MKAKKAAKIVKGFQHREVSGEFLNPDVCRGRKDGRMAPDAWSSALNIIEADECNAQEQTRATIKQVQAEVNEYLVHTDKLLEQNKEAQQKVEADGLLPPETTAHAQYRSAMRDLSFAILLTAIDLIAVIFIAKQIFGEHILIVAPIGVLLTGGIVFGIRTLLEHLPVEKRTFAKKTIIYMGIAFVFIGLIGLILLRSVTFDVALAGEGAVNMREISLGNLLLMIGLGLGVPLIVGVLFETEAEKLKTALIPLRLYAEEREIKQEQTECKALIQRLQEFDNKLDDITAEIIKLRQNRYRRGFIKGIQKNPEKEKFINQILERR